MSDRPYEGQYRDELLEMIHTELEKLREVVTDLRDMLLTAAEAAAAKVEKDPEVG
jgi:hypothetical protein